MRKKAFAKKKFNSSKYFSGFRLPCGNFVGPVNFETLFNELETNKSDFSCAHKIGRHLKLKKGSQDRQNVAKGSRIKEYVCFFVNKN